MFQIDCYSFGVLVCEMFSRELPDQRRRHIQLAQVTNHTAEHLIRRCIQLNPADRPTMEEVIVQLENMAREL